MAVAPVIDVTDADFEQPPFRDLAFNYSVFKDRLIGSDPERPELGSITVMLSATPNAITTAKFALMLVFCAGLSEAQKTRRIYLKLP